MDLTRPVIFRTADLNDATPAVGKPGLTGRSIDVCDLSPVAVDQYIDKRSQSDGMDFQGIGNLYMGTRTFDMRGMLYAPTRTAFWIALTNLRGLLDPVQCYAEDEANEGYLPLSFSQPTGPASTKAMYVLARPGGLRYVANRDQHGSNAKVSGQVDAPALGMQWSCQWTCRDQRVYGTLHTVTFSATTSGNWTNAGDYPSMVDITLVVNGSAGSAHVVLGPYDLTITWPAGTNPRTIRYRGRTKLLTVLDTAFSATNEILRQDFLSFAVPNSDTQHPLILPGVNAYAVTASGLLAGCKLEFTDAYA